MIFKDKTGWNLARVKFLVAFITVLYKAKTVNFLKLSEALGGQTQVESNLRKIQRFFAGYVIVTDPITKLIFSLLPGHAPYRLCLDRTNWKFGKTDINILTLGVCYEGVAIPLMWTMLAKRGNSNQRERMELINRYITLFGANTIESILADREFIGDDWISDLTDLKIKFYFRIKENMLVFVPGKGVRQAYQFFNYLPKYRAVHPNRITKVGTQWVYLSGVKVLNKDGYIDFVIIATLCYDPCALTVYKDRWQIETMFRSLKTSGFNIEDTHLSDLERISKMLNLLCIAFIWAYLTGIYCHRNIMDISEHVDPQKW